MVLRGDRVRLRSLTSSDGGWILATLLEPAVAEWWPGYTAQMVQSEILEGEDGEWLAVESGGSEIGIVGWSEEPTPEYRSAGIDVSLGSGWRDRGLGTDTVRTLARWLIEERGHHRITIDPAVTNARAIRCYERVGFRPVGIMRQYERLPSGEYRDGLLMDMLAGELSSGRDDPQAQP